MQPANQPNILQAAADFCWAAGRAFSLNIQSNLGGNISIRIGPDRFLTKPTGIGLVDCLLSDLVAVDGTGTPLDGHALPTKEIQVHLSLFEARPDVNAIVHYHAPHATAFANRHLTIPLNTLHARRIIKKIPVLPELPEGSAALSEAVVEAFADPEIVGLLMANHGLITIGSSLRQAQYMAELIEETARTELYAALLTPGALDA